MGRGQSVVMWMLAVAVGGAMAPLMAQGAAPATTAPAVAAARTPEAIIQDLKTVSAQLHDVLPSLAAIADDAARKDAGPKALPLLKKMSDLLAEFAAVQKDPAEQADLMMQHYQFEAFMVGFGDKAAQASLEAESKSTNPATHLMTQSALVLGQWWQNSKDAGAQDKLLDGYAAIAKANPTEDGVASTLGMMAQLGGANDAVKKKAVDLIRTTLKGDAATQILAQLDAAQVQKNMQGQTIDVAGRTTTGGKFTSTSWKGKVVLVDFWATWCGPCKAELPRTKKLYDDYHAKGLEVVGVDCDSADDTVNAFTKENGMAWPQLREESQKEDQWHPLAKQWHVDGIPTMFLIDKKGILRYVDAREDTETKVKELLAEGGPK